MLFKLRKDSKLFDQLIIEHKGEEISWSVSLYSKTLAPHKSKLTPAEEKVLIANAYIYKEVNHYLTLLHPSRHDAIFALYKEIFSVIEHGSANYELAFNKLTELVAKLYEQLPFQEFLDYVQRPDSGIVIPTEMPKVYDVSGSESLGHFEATTYLLGDHINLIALAMALRFMLPIWGEFNNSLNTSKKSGTEETTAMRLLIRAWPNDCEPRERLRIFIEAHQKGGQVNPNAIYSGIPTDEIPAWYLSIVFVRRLATAPLSNNSDDPSVSKLVRMVFYAISDNNYNQSNRRFNEHITDKHSKLRQSGDNDKTSFIENHKITENVSEGERAAANADFLYISNLMRKYHPAPSMELYEECKRYVRDVVDIEEHAMLLMEVVLGVSMAAPIIRQLSLPAALSGLALTQAILYEWGLYNLAVLMTAKKLQGDENKIIRGMDVSLSSGSVHRITKEQTNTILNLYPHHRPIPNKSSQAEIDKARRANTPALEGAEIIANAIGSGSLYTYTGSPIIMEKSTVSKLHEYNALKNIFKPCSFTRSAIAALIIKVNEQIAINVKSAEIRVSIK